MIWICVLLGVVMIVNEVIGIFFIILVIGFIIVFGFGEIFVVDE